jgi:aminoglycoside 6'-N-acetyltransferase I
MRVEPYREQDFEDWLGLRYALWPQEGELESGARALAARMANMGDAAVFLARSAEGRALGFAEASLRRDYVNGCATSPVAFLEGLYVEPAWRRQGIARALCAAVESWAVKLGCAGFASDALLANEPAHHVHMALGFRETERVVYFRKPLAGRDRR